MFDPVHIMDLMASLILVNCRLPVPLCSTIDMYAHVRGVLRVRSMYEYSVCSNTLLMLVTATAEPE